MHTRLLPVLALALASTVGCSSAPPTLTTTQPQAEPQRQIAQADDDMDAADGQETQALAEVESRMPAPLSVQALPQKLDPSQVVELPADRLKDLPVVGMQSDDRSIQQRRSGIRSGGWRGYGGRTRGLRYYSYGSYYYPYFLYSGYYYPYAYYPYTYAYYPYSYYNYNYYPYYTPFYAYSSFYYPYRFSSYGRRYYSRGWRGGRGRR